MEYRDPTHGRGRFTSSCAAGVLGEPRGARWRLLGAVLLAVLLAWAGSPAAPDDKIDWLRLLEGRIAPLEHARGDRWPLILWTGTGSEALSSDVVRMLLSRGITQHIRLDPAMIPVAQALQAAGSPVIVMEAQSFDWPGNTWPYPLAGALADWAHQYPRGAVVPERWRRTPSPTRFGGWSVAADRMRTTLRQFREAGVTIDALWLDYEGEPSQASYGAALASPSTREVLPPEVLISKEAFQQFSRQLWIQLLSTYVAAPAREIFPRVSVTNWVATLSSAGHPVLGWDDREHPVSGPTLFTATNPVAYAIDHYFVRAWREPTSPTQEQADRVYMHVMLRQVSEDAYNRQHLAPYLNAVVWVSRWVPDLRNPSVPVMSRAAYREALRHLWLRGIDAMEVFNAVHAGRVDMALMEVQDAAAVYGEMLAFRDFLDGGAVMNFDYPGPHEDGPFWSGLRLGEAAVVRVSCDAATDMELAPWSDRTVSLSCEKPGRTYRLYLRGAEVQAKALPPQNDQSICCCDAACGPTQATESEPGEAVRQ